jgi:hypothetical protein
MIDILAPVVRFSRTLGVPRTSLWLFPLVRRLSRTNYQIRVRLSKVLIRLTTHTSPRAAFSSSLAYNPRAPRRLY